MKENTKNVLLGVLIVGLVAMTVAYAALSTTLRINGTASVPNVKWDIHFENAAVDTQNTTITSNDYALGTLSTSGAPTLIDGMHAKLSKPTDKLVVNFDIVNRGTIDAKVASFAKHIAKDGGTAVTTNTNDVITYTITCGTGGNENETLAANGGTSHCTLTVQYDNNAMGGTGQQTSQTAGQDQTVNLPAKDFTFDAQWVYNQL